MKQIVSNYSYSPTTNVVTLTGVNIEADQLLLIVAPEVGRTMYNFASVTGTVSAGVNTRVTLNASTAGLTTTSPLVIFYDDQAAAQSVTGTVALDPASLIALENVTVTVGSSVTISNFPSTQTVAGTVTANVPLVSSDLTGGVTQGVPVYLAGGKDGVVLDEINYVNNILSLPAISGTVTVGNSVTIGSLPAISGTVTVSQLPRVTFIDGSGSVTTANTAITVFASSTTRSYLLVQVTTGSAFVNVGATATTLNGISLSAGQGYAWETTIPQGAVSLISTTTSSRYVAKEA